MPDNDTSAVKTHYRTCNICEAMCGIEVSYRGEEVIAIKADKADPLSRGHICPKAVALQDYYTDPDRVQTPLRRRGDGWEPVTWEQALAEIGERLRHIQDVCGRQAVATYAGNPNAHNAGSLIFLARLRKGLGTFNHYSSASADQLPHHVAYKHMFGHGSLIAVPDIDRTDYMLIIGGNPVVSNGSMMTAPGIPRRLKAIQKRGGKVVVVDPRRTETADRADEHLYIKPNTDALLLLALNHVLFAEQLIETRHLGDVLTGLDDVRQAVSAYSPERVAPVTGIEAATIRRIAREMAAAPAAVCYSRMGASTQQFGGLCQWLTVVFNILSGNMDREGGAMFTTPAFDLVGITNARGKPNTFGSRHSRVRNLPYNNNEFPIATLADEILTGGEGQIRGLIAIAGNPVISAPNGPRLAQALEALDFMVAVDIYINETSRHADIILPAASGLQVSQYDIAFHINAVRNTAKYAPALFAKRGEQKYDWEIMKLLNSAINDIEDDGSTPESVIDYTLRHGPYAEQGMSLELLRGHPHGLDLGALQPNLKQRLQTPDGKLHLAPPLYLEDLGRLEQTLFSPATADTYPFSLISRRVVRSHNSWTHNSRRLIKGKNQCTLLLNPHDAARLRLDSGQLAQVSSRTGVLTIEVQVSDEMMPGVVSIPHGWGHDLADTQLRVAATRPGVNINDLTDDTVVDELTGNASFSGVPVAIKAA
ncbi:molybdopterin-dependent oxidoreductase [Exilibacterium tricleocarpae]|uniref:Molybdopterin-dependent oxidoreductase n=1 Tax=Exilibacterium tricleocarpae TaxID=2591008 RepID=A0A545UA11_9GAMM|nr:molybdopterin-dependent oxidoreductase [Exilibacterium tricleocarpae]TQV86301.1 molybdopterin-dependent oxidoreductase [Exilibacterium tricleocarpae]